MSEFNRVYEKAIGNITITQEMRDHFDKRTNKHIEMVKKWAKKIVDAYPEYKDLLKEVEDHDQTKFKDPEYDPYVIITWSYKMKDEGKEFKLPDNINDLIVNLRKYRSCLKGDFQHKVTELNQLTKSILKNHNSRI